MTKRYFGTDGIRGLVGSELINENMAFRLGQAMVRFCVDHNLPNHIIVGHDTRESADTLVQAFIAGVKKAGGSISFVGTISSPGLAYLAKNENVGLGLMITASHNPSDYNGFKIFDAAGDKFDLEHEHIIENLIDSLSSEIFLDSIEKEKHDENFRHKYENFLQEIFKDDDFSSLRVVVDCANGGAHEVAPNVLIPKVGKLSVMNIFPDGKNINAACGSLYPDALVAEVLKTKADLGIAFDGDCDRIIIVDEEGNILTGDHILLILARLLRARGELESNYVVSTVMSNYGFVQALQKIDLEHHETDVGDSVVAAAMRRLEANLGGEEAGHIILSDYLSSGDGLLSALMIMRALKHFNEPLSSLVKDFQSMPKVLKNLEVKEKKELTSFPEYLEILEKIKQEIRGQGRVLVRYSGTEPKCRVMVEHHDSSQAEKFVDMIVGKIEELVN